MLALSALLVAAPSFAFCPRLPHFEPITIDNYLATPAQAELLYERWSHCAQPRQALAWKAQPDGGAQGQLRYGKRRIPIKVPASFLSKTLQHINLIVRDGHARYLFFLDFDHGHLYFPKKKFDELYGEAWRAHRVKEVLESALADSRLRILYHTQEFIEPKKLPREFLASYTEQPWIMPSHQLKSEGSWSIESDHQALFTINFSASHHGAYALEDGAQFDFNFEDESFAAQLKRVGVPVKQPPPPDEED